MWPRATEQGEETKKWLTTYQFNHSLSYICTRTHTRTHAHTHTHTHKVHAHARTHTYTHSHSQVDTITSIHTIITQFTVLQPVNAVQSGRRHTKLNPSLGPWSRSKPSWMSIEPVKPITLCIARLVLELCWSIGSNKWWLVCNCGRDYVYTIIQLQLGNYTIMLRSEFN